jgi:hypothetical protein
MTKMPTRLGAVLVSGLMSLNVACLFRPSYEESSRELASLIDPALESWNSDYKRLSERYDDPGACSDPFVGPRDGLRPSLTYELRFSVLGEDPEDFLDTVEEYWRSEGLDTQARETDIAKIRSSGRDGYIVSVDVNYATERASVGGSGPCVDNPAT